MRSNIFWKPALLSVFALCAIGISAGAANATSTTIPSNLNVNQVSIQTQPLIDKETSVSGLNLSGKTLTTDSLTPMKAQGKVIGGKSRFVELQKYNTKTKKWSVVRSNYAQSNGTFAFALDQTKVKSMYRIHVKATSGYKAFTGKSTTVQRKARPTTTSYVRADKAIIAPWADNKAHVSVNTILFTGERKPFVTLQEKVNGKWKNLKTVNNWGYMSFTLPKGKTTSNNATKTYRFTVSGTALANGTTSKSFSVKWENPRKYKGTALKAYNYSKKYCPNMLVTVKHLPKGIAGQAYSSTGRTLLDPDIQAKDLRTVTLHECAHHMQYKLYGSDWNKFEKRMNSLYKVKSKGIEHNADCIANVWHKNTYWGYKKTCSGSQLAAARKIASGKKW